jgi:oxygen tolerance protein BatD
MKAFIKHIGLTFIAIIIASSIFAQDFEFTAATSRTEVATGDRFQIEFAANGKITNFKAPNLSNFRVLSGPNQSTNMSWVNGKTNASYSYSYILMAVKEGEFTIGPAVAAHEGSAYKTNSLKITVSKGANVQQQSNSQSNSKVSQEDVAKDLFIKSSVNKTTAYQGEQLIASYKLYTKVNIAGNELVKNADLNGFWSQEIDMGQTQWNQEVIGGYRWNVATIRKIVLFPQRSGDLEIDPLEMKFIVQRRASGGGNSPFDQFFGRVENVEIPLKSKAIKIKVLPHPTEGKPESFNGAVGQLNMTSNITANKVKANEAINIKIKISGKGNIPLIDNLGIEFPDDFETYDPKINDNISTTSNGVSGSKEFDYLVIPRHAGTFNIAPIEFSYFDPSTKKYKTLTSELYTIEVEKGDGSANNVTYSGANKEDVEILGNDIRYIHLKEIKVSSTTTSFYNSLLFYILLLSAPLLFVLAFIFINKIRASQKDVIGNKRKKAGKVASKHLASAQISLTNNQQKEFYENISKAIYGYVSDKLNIALSELSKENITQKLSTIQISEATIKELLDTLELCEMARFAPISVSSQEIYNKAENSINKIEEEAKS